jgi:hypothetical protein
MRQNSWPTPSYLLWLLSLYFAVAIAAAGLFVIGALAISIPAAIPEALGGIAVGVGIGVAIRHLHWTRRHLQRGYWWFPSDLAVIAIACLLTSVPIAILIPELAIPVVAVAMIAGVAVGMVVGNRGYHRFMVYSSILFSRARHFLSHEHS